ncbi:right-handed parallel beta-helix repeat-containing protein [bacterium]|nr:right-handed parallel beta-helix repeat-containing protein [bacterium]
MRRISPIALLLCSLCALPATADTIDVDVNGTGDFLTIQEGLDAAASGDIVRVFPGTYGDPGNQYLDFGGRDIVLRSAAGQNETIIDLSACGWSQGFRFTSGESPLAVVEGFTVANGAVFGDGAGFYCNGASPTFRNCLFTRCYANGHHVEGAGGAGCLRESQSLIENCSFVDNGALYQGGALYITSCPGITLRDCIFVSNEDSFDALGAVVVSGGSVVTIEGCTFTDNGCGAVGFSSVWLSSISGCTFVGNGGNSVVDFWSPTGGSGIHITRSIFAFNDTDEPIDCLTEGPLMRYCCFYESGAVSLCGSSSEDDNLFVDPLLCGLAEGDYTLCANSPCLPANNEWTEWIGAYDEGCPPCNSPVESVTWGVIKALYR